MVAIDFRYLATYVHVLQYIAELFYKTTHSNNKKCLHRISTQTDIT